MSEQAATALAPLRRTRVAARVLWRFSRPHTVVGTAVSVLGIFAIAVDGSGKTVRISCSKDCA